MAMLLAVLFAALFLARSAAAHAVGLSRGEYRVTDRGVRALYVFSGPELATVFPSADADHDGRLSRAELEKAAADPNGPLAKGIVQATSVRVDGSPCRPHLESASEAEGDAIDVQAFFVCDRAPGVLSIDCGFLDAFAAGHRHLATVSTDASESAYVLVLAQKRIDVDLGAPPAPKREARMAFTAMVWTGVEHIWTGYDHLAFLFGLVLLGGRPRSLVGVISAFTVAHSITLGMAVLGLVSVRPAIVEPAIALSIAYVGIENIFGADPAKRWRITFPFGLVHGFGFAGALTSLALPRAQMPLALLAFNLGVELGQLAVLAVVLPVVLWARRYPVFRVWGVRVLSFALSVAGFLWFFWRVGAV
ncbi:MAG TPA: HupE/UreJ family protein [Polyangiaceae bacterium]|jgi:hydrogenase/urease accessory protein HupE|nr:HupE/UreJ family protein [Polyangiaceae bacterium]